MSSSFCTMKIFLCSSYKFVKEYVELAKQLETLGHTVILPEQTNEYLSGSITGNNRTEKENKEQIKQWRLQSCDKIKEADCLLVANYEKNWIPWHIWSAVFMKMSIGFYLRKPIYILNSLPNTKQLKSVEEISIMWPIILNGDITKIK